MIFSFDFHTNIEIWVTFLCYPTVLQSFFQRTVGFVNDFKIFVSNLSQNSLKLFHIVEKAKHFLNMKIFIKTLSDPKLFLQSTYKVMLKTLNNAYYQYK